ncbi:hypothetical protein COLU111180_04210 [Cohnella lubricantis]|uniref:Uncharacterized protein n=1 Tax=Cohnella lubricantis TaxID=2163172 RepID=A0A841TB63_9BACL|nr:hypothetical protein [Cohnella lubricantis]MBB6676490.1 hypothetical protein [Cohnella lubricantis]MBP2117107.1 uncharacterized protein Smg (DUF494 family) [Cohnella lubricantis]
MPNDKDTLEEIKRKYAMHVYEGHEDNVNDVIRYLLQQNEQQQAEIEREKEELDRLNNVILRLQEDYERSLAVSESLGHQLQQSREENEQLIKDRDFWVNLYNQERDLCKGQKENLREINERIGADAENLLVENERLRGELEQVKAERDDYRKVLEWYEKRTNWEYFVDHSAPALKDSGERARDILSRYPSEKGE